MKKNFLVLAVFSLSLFAILSGCAKVKQKEPLSEEASRSVAGHTNTYRNPDPAFEFPFDQSLSLSLDPDNSEQWQKVILGDPNLSRMEVSYIRSVQGVTDDTSLAAYLAGKFPDRPWKQVEKFGVTNVQSSRLEDGRNGSENFVLSNQKEVYRVLLILNTETEYARAVHWASDRLKLPLRN